MNKDIMLGVLIGFILTAILGSIGGFFLYSKFTTMSGFPGVSQPETAFSGKVATISPPDHPEYKQYILQSADGQTVYLITTPAQESILRGKMGKDVRISGTPAAPDGSWTGGVKVTTVYP